MPNPTWADKAQQIFTQASVIPVLVIHDLEHALPLAAALFAGGIKVLELTLRTPVALDALKLLTKHYPEALIGVGTVQTAEQLRLSIDAGAKFAISPGSTSDLLAAGLESTIPFIPGISTVSELMDGLNQGYTQFKLFPANAVGGVAFLKAVVSPFPQARFCPTGGINNANYREYLSLPNVSCVGGSWIVPEEAILSADWQMITDLCKTL